MALQGQVHVADTGLFEKEHLKQINAQWDNAYGGVLNYSGWRSLVIMNFCTNYHAPEDNPTTYDLEEAMDNLASSTTASINQIETLVKTNTDLIAQLKQASETIKKFTYDNEKLPHIIEKSINVPVGTGMLPGGVITPVGPAGARTRIFNPNGYYWSHGYRYVFGHNSQTCTRPKEEH
eukprot:15028039-Ditylum_brightwellii.AAC.1